MLLDPRREARGPSERELYAKILKDQRLNILWLVPGMILFYLAATVTLHRWPELFIKRNGHVGFAAVDYVELRSRRNPRDRGRKRRGKSTFVKILAGIIEPSSGQIFFRGEQVETPTLAFMEAIKSTAIKVLDSKYANWNRDDGFKVMQDFLTRFPKIDGVWAQDDDIALGVLDALRQAKREKEMFVVGGAGMKEIVKRVKDKDSQVPVDIIYSPSMIGTAMEVTALHFVTKVAINGTYILDSPLITPENADQWYFPNSPF